MTILNRQGLENGSCECYAIAKEDFDRLLGGNVDAKEGQNQGKGGEGL